MVWLSDEEYIYRQDIKEKKATGRGIYHKKNGSKSKKCTLPSDYMTKKEREAMNGEVMSYNPNKFYSYAEFKQFPMEYQIKYINSLLTRYNCSFAAIAKYVFQISNEGLRNHFTKQNQLQYINMPAKNIGKALHAGNEKLRKDVEKALWPNRDEEIQNGSKSGSCEITLTGGGSKYNEEELDELTLEEKVAEAIDTVTLFASNNVPMPPEKIDEVFVEKTGMTRKEVEQAIGRTELANPGESISNPEHVEEIADAEDSTDVKSFSIIMDHIDMDIIQYVSGLFEGKKIVVSFEVKEVL